MRRDDNNRDDNFLKTFFSYGVIVRADIDEIQHLKQYLSDRGITICFQKVSSSKLFIKELRDTNDYHENYGGDR